MTKIDIGDLLRRAVKMSSEPVYKLEAIRDQIVCVCKDLWGYVKNVMDNERNADLARKSLLNRRNLPIRGPQMDARAWQVVYGRRKLTLVRVVIVFYVIFIGRRTGHSHVELSRPSSPRRTAESTVLPTLLRGV